MIALGLHLMPSLDLLGTPRPSVIAQINPQGRLVRLDTVETDADIVSAVPDDAATIAIDTPLHVPNERGQRPVETLLAWLDMPAFPVSGARMQQIFGGCRGASLLSALASPDRRIVEALPEAVLRQLSWQRGRPAAAAPLGLAAYRAAWLGSRAPRYRPKGTGRARTDGLVAAADLLSDAVDLDGWWPSPPGDDWDAIADAARLDAIAAALVAHRLIHEPEHTLMLGNEPPTVILSDADMRDRAMVNVERMRSEGAQITYPA
jgi:predicted nuclease with RNAse H fold